MTNSTSVIVDFESRIAQIAFFIAKRAKIHHLYWKIPFVLLLSLTQQQLKRTLQIQMVYFSSFTIKNEISAIVGLKSTITQVEIDISEEVFPSVQRWNIQFVLLLSQTQQQHKGDLPLQMTYY